jgi:hypothetical protein
MSNDRLSKAIELIDHANSEDPNREIWQGVEYPKELLYAQHMSRWLERLDPQASEARQLAVRGQHIRRWTVPREEYPEGREGYLRWRKYLYRFHAEKTAALLLKAGYDEETIALVKRMIGKEGIKRDADVQIVEDVACLVFLAHYLPEFAHKHEEDKLIDIVRKTWKKMSEQGHAAALALSLPDDLGGLVAKALHAQGG